MKVKLSTILRDTRLRAHLPTTVVMDREWATQAEKIQQAISLLRDAGFHVKLIQQNQILIY